MHVLGISAAAVVLLAALFVQSFRAKWGPVQRAVRRFNRDVTNPRQLATAGRPGAYAAVVHHRGRVSGTAYRTPAVAVPAGDGFVFALPYGPGADWVRNVLAAGTATVEHEGRSVEVQRPRLVDESEANRFFPPREQRMHRVFGVVDFLHVAEVGR
ncbi:nitroreductase family deazaflavin-dependent oxidoreductase [Blastococcus xanthinilyticus]|uniref:Deazaflavin-dependent oxidoreductase (Nitroreductase family) n=1 Tax=Blastococcus xanthinilyticus TaxID=1564164 RepID=A0A5S5CW89_9ACTN|nr:nitroreductase family deazaflavin-dependent oxidoreductase [Blastococcus xanthinilyticus]TYP87993.1 deazaflavin-dependent oxidoreductase (nitroreductase family) [Blastococcus xanthinilyticus]